MKKYIISLNLFVLFTCMSTGQEIKKDTLFFKFDEKYLIKCKINTKQYYLKEIVNEGDFSFKEIRKFEGITSKNEICLKKYIRSSDIYDKNKKTINGYKLWGYLKNHTIFIVSKIKGEKEYIEVQAYYEIE